MEGIVPEKDSKQLDDLELLELIEKSREDIDEKRTLSHKQVKRLINQKWKANA